MSQPFYKECFGPDSKTGENKNTSHLTKSQLKEREKLRISCISVPSQAGLQFQSFDIPGPPGDNKEKLSVEPSLNYNTSLGPSMVNTQIWRPHTLHLTSQFHMAIVTRSISQPNQPPPIPKYQYYRGLLKIVFTFRVALQEKKLIKTAISIIYPIRSRISVLGEEIKYKFVI